MLCKYTRYFVTLDKLASMNPIKNPFVPGAGTPPPVLEGRTEILKKALTTLGRIKEGRPSKSFLLIGLRGVGKTVLLNRIRGIAQENGYHAALIEIHENKSLAALLVPCLRQILLALDKKEKMSDQVRQGLRILKSFISGIKISINDIDVGLGITPETGIADSGDLEVDLPELLFAVAQAAAAKKTAIAIIIDELQYLNEIELSALIMAVHKINQHQLPLVLVGAGLPQLVGLCGRSKSYAERLFDFLEIGPLDSADAKKALQEPVQSEGVSFEDKALDRLVSLTKGYPYFIQQWGHYAWNLAESSPIDNRVIDQATQKALENLDQSFFRVRFDRLTPREKVYLRAMSELGPRTQRSGDIAAILGVEVRSVAPIRSSLIKKGMIYSPQHGDTAFTVPLFDQFMKRIMPDFKRR